MLFNSLASKICKSLSFSNVLLPLTIKPGIMDGNIHTQPLQIESNVYAKRMINYVQMTFVLENKYNSEIIIENTII